MHWRTTEINLLFYDENAPKGQRLKQSFSMLKIVIKMLSICVNAHLENQNRSRWISRDLVWYAVWETTLTYVRTLAFHILWALNWTMYELRWLKLYYQFIPETLTSSRIKERKLNKMQLILNGFSPTQLTIFWDITYELCDTNDHAASENEKINSMNRIKRWYGVRIKNMR